MKHNRYVSLLLLGIPDISCWINGLGLVSFKFLWLFLFFIVLESFIARFLVNLGGLKEAKLEKKYISVFCGCVL